MHFRHKQKKVQILIYAVIFLIGAGIFIVSATLIQKAIFQYQLNLSLQKSIKWLTSVQDENGKFTYLIDVQSGNTLPGNLLSRQAMSTYSLALSYKKSKDPELGKSVEKGVGYLLSNAASGSAVINEASVATMRISSNEGVSENNTVALTLLAIITYLEADKTQETEYLETANALANYLYKTQVYTGAYMYFDDPNKIDDYNNGETMYALAKMYHYTGNELYLQAIEKSADYFIEYYGNAKFNSGFYPWGMEAFYYLYQSKPEEKYWQFMKNYTNAFMNSFGTSWEDYLKGRGSVAPLDSGPVMLEGINHVSRLAKIKDPQLNKQLNNFIELLLKHFMTYQINGPLSTRFSNHQNLDGAICMGYYCNSVRIDSAAHYIAAINFYLID